MEKVYETASKKSKYVNLIVKYFSNKKVYLNKELTKKFIEKYSVDGEKIPSKLGMKNDGNFSIPIYTYNGTLKNPKDKVLIYLHGGSYVEEATKFQYKFAIKIAEQTNSTLVVPIYTLAPKGNYKKALDDILEMWFEIIKNNKEINILGDSAGGGLAMTLAMVLREKGMLGPKNILLLSPWLDLKLNNPKIKQIEPYDSMSGVEGNKYAGELWSQGTDIDDYLVSPIYGSFEKLGLITMVVGEYDFLKPDSEVLKEKLKNEGILYNYYEYKKQIHDFAVLPIKEGKQVINDFSGIINKD